MRRTRAIILSIVFAGTALFAHGGGFDSQGGHNDTKAGTYHFHRGVLAGKSYSSKSTATTALAASSHQPSKGEEVGQTVHCTLRHSAVAGLDESARIDVHTTDNDEIDVTIQGIGLKEAVFNGSYRLTLIKKDRFAYYYVQPSAEGFTMWVYFRSSNTITYSKLRAFPADGSPSSYLMIAKCDPL
jgi:hypothetical protein